MTPPGNEATPGVSVAVRTRLGLTRSDSLTWALHTLLVAVLIWNHEPWRDELQAWSIAMASNNPLDLLPNTRLEGRPPGWQLLLWPFAQVVSSTRMLQLVTFVVGSLAAWWWLRRSGLDWRIKAAVLFGFLFTGGYLVHSRDYVLSFMVLVAATAVHERRGAGWRLALVLCTLAWVNAFSLAMSAAFLVAAWMPEILQIAKKSVSQTVSLLSSMLACIAWFGWSAYLTYPTDDNQFNVGAYKGFGKALTKSFIPMDYEWPWLQRIDDFLAAALALAVLAWAWRWSRVAFIFVGLSLAMLMYNLTYGYGDYWWHFGNAYIVIFAATCFGKRNASDARAETPMAGRFGTVAAMAQRAGLAALLIMAALNLASTRYGAGRGVHSARPYSMTAAAAEQIREICDDCTVIVDWDAVGAGISARLDGRELFYLNRNEFGTFAKFSNKNTAPKWEDGLAAMERFDKPLLIQTAFMSGPAPQSLELIGIHLDGVQDTNLIWQSADKRIIPND